MSYAATIKVGANYPVKSITKALQQAQDGDMIVVDGGVYREGNIAIHKKVILVGVNNPVIDGEKKYEPISIHVPGVTVKGFTVRGSGKSNLMDVAAIKIYNVNDVIIKDNIIDDSFFGIYAQEAKHCTIENNQLKAYGENEVLVGNGIHAWKSDHLRISGNTVHGHRDGVYLEFVTNTEVRDNIVEDNLRYGLHFMFSHDNGYYHNTFSRNGAGVAVMYTRNVRMEYNVFNENWGDASYGLLLKDIMDSHIENNVFAKNTTGILMEGSNRVHIQRNRFEANGWALRIQSSCMDNVLLENNFIQNTFDLATNGALVSNRFERNYWDKYEGYDLDKDRVGDVPHRPVSLYSMIVEKHPMSMLLFRSFMVSLLDRTERMLPSLTPESLKDDYPLMKPVDL
jgi:nitrous oxidase accessory protein